MFWTKLLFIITAIFLGWLLYRYIRSNPQAFAKANLGKSIFTLGILALLLIGLVVICVVLLKG